MFQLMKKRIKNEKGLTLIELLAVIVILSIVAAIAIPAIGNIIENSRIKAAKADVANVLAGANIYFTDNATDDSADSGELAPYVENWGTLEDVKAGVTVKKVTTGGNELSLASTSTLKVGNTTITITNANISSLEVDNADPTATFVFTKP